MFRIFRKLTVRYPRFITYFNNPLLSKLKGNLPFNRTTNFNWTTYGITKQNMYNTYLINKKRSFSSNNKKNQVADTSESTKSVNSNLTKEEIINHTPKKYNVIDILELLFYVPIIAMIYAPIVLGSIFLVILTFHMFVEHVCRTC
jgi:hypothetical protein